MEKIDPETELFDSRKNDTNTSETDLPVCNMNDQNNNNNKNLNCSESANTLKNTYLGLKNIIHHSWIEMKTEFISLVSYTLNKEIEIVYMLENRIESMLHDKIKYTFNNDKTRITLLYYHSNEDKKSYYYPIIRDNEINLFMSSAGK